MTTANPDEQLLPAFSQPLLMVLLVAALCWWLDGSALAAEGSHLLDGKTFIGKNGEMGQDLAEYEDEEIVFENGLFTSVSCEPYHFGSSPYSARLVDGKIHFSAVTESPTHGKIAWQGVVDGAQAEVTFVWTKERWYWDIHREYWFHGKLKQ